MRAVACLGVVVSILGCSTPSDPAPGHDSNSIGDSTAGVTRTDLGTLGGLSSYGTDISNPGVVVGWSNTSSQAEHAFRWTRTGGMVDLGTLPGDQRSLAVAVADNGEIVGVSEALDSNGDLLASHPVLWRADGSIHLLDIQLGPGVMLSPSDLNGAGQVIGSADLDVSHAWIWQSAGGVQDISSQIPNAVETYAGRINASGVVAGTNADCAFACNYRGFVWSGNRGYQDLGIGGTDPLNTVVTALDINDGEQVVGWIQVSTGAESSPFVWESGTFRLLPNFPAEFPYGYAQAINRFGTVVGASYVQDPDAIQAAAWLPGGGIFNLNGQDPAPSVALAINDVGVAAGWSEVDAVTGSNHATVWSIGPGLGATAAGGSVPRAGRSLAAAPSTRVPEPCLGDPKALVSRAHLIGCVVGSR